MANIISDDRRFPALFIYGKPTRIWQDNQIETAKEYAAERSKWISKENLRLCWVPWHDVSKLIISAAQNFHKPDISIFTDDEREYLAHQIWDKTGLFPDWSTHKPEPRKFTSPTDEIEWDEPVVISPWVGPRGCWERKTWS